MPLAPSARPPVAPPTEPVATWRRPVRSGTPCFRRYGGARKLRSFNGNEKNYGTGALHVHRSSEQTAPKTEQTKKLVVANRMS
jgi:hypothetical protein